MTPKAFGLAGGFFAERYSTVYVPKLSVEFEGEVIVTRGAAIISSGDVVVNYGAMISATGNGHTASLGGAPGTGGSGGGGYGGKGGGSVGGSEGRYGNSSSPIHFGSGGTVGAGGGAIHLSVLVGTLYIDGVISSNGNNITSGGAGAGMPFLK